MAIGYIAYIHRQPESTKHMYQKAKEYNYRPGLDLALLFSFTYIQAYMRLLTAEVGLLGFYIIF